MKEIFTNFFDDFLYSYDYNEKEWEKRDKIFAYPDKIQSNLEITELVNSPEVINVVNKIKEENQELDEKEIREKVVEFAKEVIAGSKEKEKEEYWGDFGEVKDDMFIRGTE